VCERVRFRFLSKGNVVPAGSGNRVPCARASWEFLLLTARHHVRPETSDAGHRLAPHIQSAAGIRLWKVRRSDFQRRVCMVCRRGQHHTLFETARVRCVVPVVCCQSKGQIVDGKSRNHVGRAQDDRVTGYLYSVQWETLQGKIGYSAHPHMSTWKWWGYAELVCSLARQGILIKNSSVETNVKACIKKTHWILNQTMNNIRCTFFHTGLGYIILILSAHAKSTLFQFNKY